MDEYLNQKSGAELAEKIASRSRVKIHECYQCGKCSAGCPMAHTMDIMPRQLVQYMKLGMMDEILESRTIWMCAACHTCVERCPHNIDIPSLMEYSRQEAKRKNIVSVKEVDKFNTIFLENVHVLGKSQEVVLEGLYNVTTGNLLQNMESVPHMLKTKMVRPEINTVKNRREVTDLMDRAKKEDAK